MKSNEHYLSQIDGAVEWEFKFVRSAGWRGTDA